MRLQGDVHKEVGDEGEGEGTWLVRDMSMKRREEREAGEGPWNEREPCA